MMERPMLLQKILLRLLRSVDYDPSRLSARDRAEAEALAERTGIELPRPGVKWGSSDHADQIGGEPTPAPR